MPQPLPQPRIDTLVTDAVTGEQRRHTEYSGTAWYGRPPDTAARAVIIRQTFLHDDAAVFLPDSLPYRRSALADGLITCTAAHHSHASETSFVIAAEATWGDDPRGGDMAWVLLRLAVYGYEPLGISYRVVAVCDPAAVAD